MSGLDYELHDEPVPIEFEVCRVEHERITLVRAGQMDGSVKWKVLRGNRSCLSKSGEWDFESMPSGRTDEYLAEHRFDAREEATRLAQVAAKEFIAETQERYRLMRAND